MDDHFTYFLNILVDFYGYLLMKNVLKTYMYRCSFNRFHDDVINNVDYLLKLVTSTEHKF